MTGVLVVDDSSFARLSITRQLTKDPEIDIIGYAKDGIEAIEKVKELKPDVVTLDIQMPGMNGLEALEHIMTEEPTPVVILSSLSEEGSEVTLRALEIGAIDFFLKQNVASPAGLLGVDGVLTSKIKQAAVTKSKLKRKKRNQIFPLKQVEKPVVQKKLTEQSKVVMIASSTGGPGALYQLVPNIPRDIPAAVLIVQHMPPIFTRTMAERLNDVSLISVKEAESGDILYEGHAYLAPGDHHMIIGQFDRIMLNQNPPVKHLRPCADVTMESVAKKYGASTIGVVLTGMGSDGTDGSKEIKAAGGKVTVQDQTTSVIFGMPGSVVEAGLADTVLPIRKMADEIIRLCSE